MKLKIVRLTSGVLILLISIYMFYYRFDIVTELFSGRPAAELKMYQLILPVFLFVIGIFLLIKPGKNEN
jgi:hypothetical protein